MTHWVRFSLLLGYALGTACGAGPRRTAWDESSTSDARRPNPQPNSSLSTATSSSAAGASTLAPSPAEASIAAGSTRSSVAAGFHSLDVPGFESALVWDPGTSAERLPVWVVAHGAGGNPEWHCQYWSEVVQSSAFLLCLRGKSMRRGGGEYYFPEHFTLGRMLDSAVSAFDARYGQRSLTSYNGYIGYSQGATMGALMLPEHAARFGLVLLAEGGYAQWTLGRARQFARNGGRAVFFACGTQSCRKGAERSLRYFAAQGVRARLGHAAGAGHTPTGPVGELSVAGLGWLVEQAEVASANPTQ